MFIASLQSIIFWITSAALLVTGGLLVFSLVRLQRQSLPVKTSHPALDLIWTLIPVGILVLLLALTYLSLPAAKTPPAATVPTSSK